MTAFSDWVAMSSSKMNLSKLSSLVDDNEAYVLISDPNLKFQILI